MTEDNRRSDLETHYTEHRNRLYRAMVLVTDDRDLSLEAVDGAYARMRRVALQRTTPDPAFEVLRRAYRKVRRTDPSHNMQGFRLPDAPPSSETAAVVAALRRLDTDHRIAAVATAYLGWNAAAIGHVTGRRDAAGLVTAAAEALARDLGVAPEQAPPLVAAALTAAGDAVAAPLSRLESVVIEGRLLRVKVAGAAAAVALASVGGVTFGVGALSRPAAVEATGPGPATSGSLPGAVTPTTGDALPTEITWEQTGLPFREGDMSAVTAGPNGFVGVGQDYSDPTGSLRLMASETGFDWTMLESPLPRNGWIQSVTYEGDRFFAVGSSVDEATGRDTPTLIASEDGESWEVLPLTVPPTVEIAGVSIRVYSSVTAVGVSNGEIVVIGSQNADEDMMPLFRDALPEDLPDIQTWGFSGNGIDVYDNQGNLLQSFTADELGVDPALLSLAGQGRTVVWRSADGGATWEEEAVGAATRPDGWFGQIAVGDDAVAAVVYGQFGNSTSLWSDRGGEWQRIDLGRGTTVTAVARLDDGFIAVGSDGTETAVWRSTDGVAWEPAAAEGFGGLRIDRLVTSPYGVLAVGQDVGKIDPIGPAVVETDDGLLVEIDSTGRYVVTDGDGVVLLELFSDELESDGAGSVVLADPDTGDVVVTLEQRVIDLAWEAAYREVEGQQLAPTPALAMSRNGDEWLRVDSTDLPAGFYPNVLALAADRILMTGWVEGGESPQPGPRAFVGVFDG